MIADKIYGFLDLKEDQPIPEGLLGEFGDDCIEGLVRQAFEKRIDKKTLRLSSIGKCLRAQAYTLQGAPKKPLQARTKVTFLFGDLIEAMVVALSKAAGCDIYDMQKKVVLDDVEGHIDGKISRYIVEIKSMSDFSFKQFKRTGFMSDSFGYIDQVNSYAYAEGMEGYVHIGVNKNTGHMHEVIHPIDMEVVDNVRHNIKLLKSCQDPEMYLRIEPERETWYGKPTGNLKPSFVCSYCDYMETCHGGSLTTLLRKGTIINYVGEWIQCDANKGGVVINE